MNVNQSKRLNKLITITCYFYIIIAVLVITILLAYIGNKIDGGTCYENYITTN